MKYLKPLYLLSGFVLLGVILYETDMHEVLERASQLGWWGAALVVLIHFISFLTDVVSWQFTFQNVPLNSRWCCRLYLIRLAGEAYNNVTPMASMGGEPLKVAFLKSHYQVGRRESSVSLVLARTINMIALIAFLIIGFVMVTGSEKLTTHYKTMAGVGLLALSIGTLLFFLIQRYRISSIAGSRLSKFPIGQRIESILHIIHDLDERLVYFYRTHHFRFAMALLTAFVNWLVGVVEVYCVLYLIGHPVSWTDAWIIEAMVQMIRSAVFFIPAGIGAQEGVFLLVVGALTGNPALGISLSVIRRSRELLWIGLGVLIAWSYGTREGLPDGVQSRSDVPDQASQKKTVSTVANNQAQGE